MVKNTYKVCGFCFFFIELLNPVINKKYELDLFVNKLGQYFFATKSCCSY